MERWAQPLPRQPLASHHIPANRFPARTTVSPNAGNPTTTKARKMGTADEGKGTGPGKYRPAACQLSQLTTATSRECGQPTPPQPLPLPSSRDVGIRKTSRPSTHAVRQPKCHHLPPRECSPSQTRVSTHPFLPQQPPTRPTATTTKTTGKTKMPDEEEDARRRRRQRRRRRRRQRRRRRRRPRRRRTQAQVRPR